MIDELEYHRPKLTDYQLAAFFHEKRYAWIEGTSKAGKTVGLMAWLTEQALLRLNINYWWVAPVYPQAEIAYQRIKRGLPVEARECHDGKLTITLPNGHIIWFKSAEKPDNLYGEDVGAVVLDEGTRIREEAWYAIRTTITKTIGKVRGIANVKGRKNWFYQLCRRAEAGEPDMHYQKVTADDAVRAGILDAAEIEDARRVLPQAVFRELYYAEPSDDGGNPFGIKYIGQCLAPALASGPAVAYGIDLAKSVDYTVIIGLNKEGDVCAFERWQEPWRETIRRINLITKRGAALVDSTGVGDPVLEELQRDGAAAYEGYKFTSESKQKLMEGLAVAIQEQRVRFPDGPIRAELEMFEYEYTRTGVRYSAPSGVHDDCVCALALAWSKFNEEGGIKPQRSIVRKSGGSVKRAPYGGMGRGYERSRF